MLKKPSLDKAIETFQHGISLKLAKPNSHITYGGYLQLGFFFDIPGRTIHAIADTTCMEETGKALNLAVQF